jgi:hypothetical protein
MYVRLFLNSFGIEELMTMVRWHSLGLEPLSLVFLQSGQANPSLQALSTCYTSAIDMLRTISKDFASMSMLVGPVF